MLPEGLRFAHGTIGRLVLGGFGIRGGDIILQQVGVLILKGIRKLWFRVQGFRVQGLGFRVQVGFRFQGLGFRVRGVVVAGSWFWMI